MSASIDFDASRLSPGRRLESIERLKQENFDVLVVGGVTGCGIALDAASRGFKVALVETTDFAGEPERSHGNRSKRRTDESGRGQSRGLVFRSSWRGRLS